MSLVWKLDTETMVEPVIENISITPEQEEKRNAIWLNEVIVFQPILGNRILMADRADCLSLEAFLRMCNLNYKIIERKNVEYISPSGKLPVLKINEFLLSEFPNIVKFLGQRGKLLSNHLEPWEKTEVQSYISLVNMVFVNAENHISWVDKEHGAKETKITYDTMHPWPLNWVLFRRKRDKVLKKLITFGWQSKTTEEVCEDIELCCRTLCERLDGHYFFGEKPTELDAIVFAHIYTMLTTNILNNQLRRVINFHTKIIQHCQRIAAKFFPEFNQCNFED